ncbi:MAG: LuxR C-terminal-related transcriptional regulator [Thermomicrobiales bacterium]
MDASTNRQRSVTIGRHHLLQTLDAALAHRVTAIVASSGHGKTTLIRQWIAQADRPVMALDCQAIDNTPIRFANRLANAAREAGIVFPAGLDNATDIVVALCDGIRLADMALAIAIDDVQHLTNPVSVNLLNLLIAEAPPQVRFILAGRQISRLHLPRLALQDDATVISQEMLDFSGTETAEFLRAQGIDVQSGAAIDAAAKANGWIAGLKLLSRSLLRESGTSHHANLSRHATFDAYVDEEVLAPLQPRVREALLLSSRLPYISHALWARLFPDLDTTATVAEIGDLLTLVDTPQEPDAPTPEPRYRLHQLLAESFDRLAQASTPKAVRDRVSREATAWFLEEGDPEQALDVAIRGTIWAEAIPLMERIGATLADHDQSRTLLHWLHRVPLRLLLQHDAFTYWLIFATFCIGDARGANDLLARVESRWDASSDPVVRSRLHACRGMQASFQRDIDAVVRESLATLATIPPHCHVERLHALTGLIEGARATGDFARVAALLDDAEAIRTHLPAQQIWWEVHMDILWPDVLALTGRLDDARQLYQQKLASLQGFSILHRGKLIYRLAAIALEQHDLAQAIALAAQIDGVRHKRFESAYWYAESWVIQARVLYAAGRLDEAFATLRMAASYAEKRGLHRVASQCRGLHAIWHTDHPTHLPRPVHPPREAVAIETVIFGEIDPVFAAIAQARAQQDFQRAVDLLHQVETQARAIGRVDVLVRAGALLAATLLSAPDACHPDEATQALARAIRAGQEGWFIRSFLDPGVDLRPLLKPLAGGTDDQDYILAIWRAMDTAFGREQEGDRISRRERDVLRLLATGASNQQISDRLYISLNTVKKHLVRINRKLGTANRTMAILRAKELGILADDDDP